jgi:hypothetical protein
VVSVSIARTSKGRWYEDVIGLGAVLALARR